MSKEYHRKKLKRNFNSIVNGAVSVHDTLKKVKKDADKETPRNKIMRTETNKKFTQRLEDMSTIGEHMRSKEFVCNNIENLYPSTLKRIFGKKRDNGDATITRKIPSKTRKMDPYEASVIFRMLTRGCSVERVLEKFPHYTPRQIGRVKQDFISKRTEEFTDTTVDRLTKMTQQRTHWF